MGQLGLKNIQANSRFAPVFRKEARDLETGELVGGVYLTDNRASPTMWNPPSTSVRAFRRIRDRRRSAAFPDGEFERCHTQLLDH
jgi:hypothetical protein